MLELFLIVGGLVGLYLILSFSPKKREGSGAGPDIPVKRDWDTFFQSLRSWQDPDRIERRLSQLTLDELTELAAHLGIEAGSDIPDDQVRTFLVLGIFRRIMEK